jgi:hypothetical protein
VTIEAGVLSLRITETGGDQVLQKLSTIDAKARAVGQATTLHFNAPNATTVAGQVQQVSRAQMQLGQAVAAATPAIQQNTRAHRDLGQAVGAGSLIYARHGQQQQRTTSQTGSLTAALGRQVAAYLTFRTVVGIYDGIAGAADRQEAAQRKLGATARLTGVSLSTITGISKDAQDKFSISSSAAADLTQAFVKMASRAGDVSKTGALMSAWMDLAAAQGLSLQDVLTGVNTTLVGQDEGVNRLGLTNPSGLWKQWADAAGTTVAKMTDQQKWLAIVNAVMDEGAKVSGEYANSLNTTAGKQQQFNAQLELTAAAYGKSIAGAREWATETGSAILRVLRVMHEATNTRAFGMLQLFSPNVGMAAAGAALVMTPERDPFAAATFTPTVGPKGQRLESPADRMARLAREKEEEKERRKATEESIGVLVQLADAHKLTAPDIGRAIALNKALNAEYAKSVASLDNSSAALKRRGDVLQQLKALEAVVLPLPKLSGPESPLVDINRPRPKLVGLDSTASSEEARSLMRLPGARKIIPKDLIIPANIKLAVGMVTTTDGPLADVLEKKIAALQRKAGIALSVGTAIGDALGDGLTASLTKGSGKNFFEAFGNSLLASLGNIVMQLGSSMLTYGLIASTFSSLLAFTPFAGITAGAGASIAAGIGLMALGAGMGAIAANNSGSRTGGGGGGSSKTAAPKPDEYAVAFDPDRKLRKNSGSAVGQTSRPLGNAPMPDARPVVNIGVLNTLTPDNAQWQRTVVESYNNGIMRGMKRAG